MTGYYSISSDDLQSWDLDRNQQDHVNYEHVIKDCNVLFSSHTCKSYTCDEVIQILVEKLKNMNLNNP